MLKNVIRQKLNEVLASWKQERGIETIPFFTVEEPPKNIGADLACNIAMVLAKQLKTNPRKLAEELVPVIKNGLADYISNVEIAGAGFLNLMLSDKLLHNHLREIIEQKDSFGRLTTGAGKKVMVEFVSANPTGPLHIGHGRGAAIGDSLARVLSHLGYNVSREYYLNDVGNQMEMLGRSLEARYRQLLGEDVPFPEDGYKGDYIKDIAVTLRNEEGTKPTTSFKDFAVREIMKSIDSDLKAFDISFDVWFSEGTIARDRNANGKTEVDEVCVWLKEKGAAYEQDGALWFATTRFGDDKDRVLRRSDGRYTYLASDIAYHKNKLSRGFDKLIDLWGADHHGYVARMKAAIQSLGAAPEALTIILYQLVSLLRAGQPVAMSTRSGEFVTLKEVIDEVGKDACRFFFLLRAPDSPLDFDLELAKKQSSDNPVFYVQYVRARCCSIFREAQSRGYTANAATADLSLLTTKEERDLIKKLISFPDTLELCANQMTPHHITAYLMETADQYHRFYEHCRVLGDDKELSTARLALVEAVASVIANGLGLLGVSAPDRM
jgi:arginyl-tRNA synthetase